MLPGRRHPDAQASVAVDRTRNDLRPRRLPDRPRLARNHRFVDVGLAARHLAVGRHAGPRSDQQHVAGAQLADGHFLGDAVRTFALRGVWHELGERVERARGLPHAAHFEPVTEQHDVDQGDELPEEGVAVQQKLRGQAIHERDGNGQRDQGHHPRLAVAELGDGHAEEG